MAILPLNGTYTQVFFIVQTSDHITGLTGAAPTVQLSKAGGAFAAAAGTVSELSFGWYKIVLTNVDLNSQGSLAYHCVATVGAGDPTDFTDTVGQPVAITSSIKRGVALPGFPFIMTAPNTFAPTPGLTVAANRMIDGGGFAPCSNPVVEVSNGWYQINLSATDLAGACIGLRFSASGATDQDITLITQP